jgi:hypothetical protein
MGRCRMLSMTIPRYVFAIPEQKFFGHLPINCLSISFRWLGLLWKAQSMAFHFP